MCFSGNIIVEPSIHLHHMPDKGLQCSLLLHIAAEDHIVELSAHGEDTFRQSSDYDKTPTHIFERRRKNPSGLTQFQPTTDELVNEAGSSADHSRIIQSE